MVNGLMDGQVDRTILLRCLAICVRRHSWRRKVNPDRDRHLSPGRSTLDSEQLPGPRHAFEFVLTSVGEPDRRSGNEVLDG
jgi:hypothetical protein